MLDKIRAILKLSRWRQHVPWTLPLVITGALLTGAVIDWRLLAVVIANVLAMAFAFMINDVADAPDDMLNPVKTKSNVISQGLLTVNEGYWLSGTIFVVSLGLFYVGGWLSFLVGLSTLILSFLYSVKPFRLKSRPIVDVLSHVLMLSALLILSGYVIYDASLGWAWLVIIGVTMASAYGQFYNQLDDFDTDKEAGLNNTAMILGKRLTKMVMYGAAALTVICLVAATWIGVFPLWLGYVLLFTFTTLALFQWDTDMRGNVSEDSVGMIQQPILIGANFIVFIWLLHVMGLLGVS